jgi:hypothetical protein
MCPRRLARGVAVVDQVAACRSPLAPSCPASCELAEDEADRGEVMQARGMKIGVTIGER